MAKKYREDKQQGRCFYWNRLSSEILQHFQVLIILASSAQSPQALSEAINPNRFQILDCYSEHSDVRTTWKLSDLIFAEGNINILFFYVGCNLTDSKITGAPFVRAFATL